MFLVGIVRAGTLICLAVGSVACSGEPGTAPASVAPASTAAAHSESAAAAVSQEPRTLTFGIEPMGLETEARGTVEVVTSGTGYTMTITVENLVPNAQYPINLHAGECPNPTTDPATAVWVVQQAPADQTGTLAYEREYTGLWDVPAAGLTLTLHGRLPMDARTHIACADLTE